MSHNVYFALPSVPDFAESFVPAVRNYYEGKPQALIDYAVGLRHESLDQDVIEVLGHNYDQGSRELFAALIYIVAEREEESIGVDFFERMQEALPDSIFKIVNKLSEDDGELVEFETEEPISFFGYITKSKVEAVYNYMKHQTFAGQLLPYTNYMQETLKKCLDKKVELVTVHSWL